MPSTPVRPARPCVTRCLALALATILSTALSLTVTAPGAGAGTARDQTSRLRAGEIGLFPDTAPSRAVKDRSRRPVEVGLQFRTRSAGSVAGVQVYKIARAKGATPRRASLWNARGKRLAKVRITPQDGAGWVTARFSNPVAIRAGRTYTVSAFSPKGRTAVTKRGLRKERTKGPLSTGGSMIGVFGHGKASKFPRRTEKKSNYWVDVVFTRSASTEDPPTPVPQIGAFPTKDTTGVPSGWAPRQVVNGTYRVTTPGAVVEDIQVNGSIEVAAPNVTIRRVEVVGGAIDNFAGPTCQAGLLVEDTTIRRGAGATSSSDPAALGAGSYTARRVEIDGVTEGFRVGGRSSGCGPVVIESSWANVVRPDDCGDWHGDGIQGYAGPALTVRQSTLILDEDGCGGTAPFFYPHSQGNTSVDIDGLLVDGGGYAFRLGMPGTVTNLAVVSNSWYYGPINVKCSVMQAWQANVVTVAANGVTTPVRSIPCSMEEGN